MYPGTIAFLFGALAAQRLPQLPALTHAACLLLLLPVAVRWRPLRVPAMAALGCFWAICHASWILSASLPADLEGKDLLIEGRVVSLPDKLGSGTRFRFRVEGPSALLNEIGAPMQIRLMWYARAASIRIGETWQLLVRLKSVHGFRNPGGFDYESWLFQHRIRATGYVRQSSRNRLLAEPPRAAALSVLRGWIGERLATLLEGSPTVGIITALAIGDRSAIGTEQWRVLSATGTNHLVAISGLHVSVIATLVFFLVKRIWAFSVRACHAFAAPRVAALAAGFAAAGYAALAGFSIPTQRALLMVAVVMGGALLQRNIRPVRVLVLALLAVLLFDPLAVLATGFWLSFAAVAVIVFGISGRLVPRGPARSLLRVQWVVAVGLVPLLLVFFQRASVVAPFANLLAVPWVSLVVVPLTLLGVVSLMPLPSLGEGLLLGADAAAAWMWWLLDALAQLPFAQWAQPMPATWTLLPALAGVGLLLAPRGFPARWLGFVLMSPMVLVRPVSPGPGEAWLTLLDVGQGLAAVIRTQNRTLLYDTGPRFTDRFDAGSAVVVPYLRATGIKRVDVLMISHGDTDHSGGAVAIAEAFPVTRVLGPGGLHEPVPEAERCRAGQSWQWDGVQFRVLHPGREGDRPGDRNNASCVLHVNAGGHSLLLAGDIERDAERNLVQRYPGGLQADVLIVPHHGSRSSSGREFIRAVRPQYALFSAGYRNRFGFPHPGVLERYSAAGVTTYSTATQGALTVRLSPSARTLASPESYRTKQRRYWHHSFAERAEAVSAGY
jgi:competence protein ComEC